MYLLNVRDILESLLPDYLNETTLNIFNYTYYEGNQTVSNASACYLALPQLHPKVLQNGTWVNATWCYDPYYGIRQRGSLGIVYSCLFAISIMLTLANLGKHGRLFLPQEKRFRAMGRRWQWYWMLFVAACAIIGGISAVDVDRDYLQSIAIIIQSFFFYLMVPGILAVVWEGVRHWSSWQERQVYDQDPFSIPQTDRRARKEFWMPLIFYLFAWLNFFLNVPRNWGGFDAQGSTQQITSIAIPSATDSRFKAAAFTAFAAWCMICLELHHAIHYYKPKNRGAFNSFLGFFRYAPLRFLLNITLLLVIVGYTAASSFLWNVNPGNQNVNGGWLYGLGYSPALLILFVNETYGALLPNEDRELIRQRIERGQAIDAEIGYNRVRKPWWWRGAKDRFLTPEQRLKALTTEVGGGQATTRNIQRNIELGNMPIRPRDEDEEPFRDHDLSMGLAHSSNDSDTSSGRAMSERTMSTAASRPQQVKSMLDV